MIYSKKLNVELNKQGIQGATGAQGEQGIQGPQGPKGDKGATGADGKNAIVMTSATTPNGEYNGQIGIWQGQVYSWNGTSWVLTSGILPTDPVLHYSFDELPEIPDGTNNFTGVIDGASYTKEDIKGGYRFTLNGRDPYIYFRTDIGAVDSLALCYRQKAISKTGGTYSDEAYIFYTDNSYSSISSFIPYPTESENIVRATIPCDKTKTVAYIRLDMFTGEGHSAVIEVTDMYIGDASYTTPIIDNSGNNHNATDVKGLVTKGVSGKAIKKINGSDKITTNFSLSGDFSWSFWCRDYMTNTERTLYICSGRRVSDGAGDELTYVQKGTGKIEAGSASDFKLSAKSIYSFGDSIWHLYTTVRQGVNYLLYKDGIYQETITLSSVEDIKFLTVANRFSPHLEEQQIGYELDDFQIFDRALSDQEVLGLYLARGSTPKRYTFADYQNSINGGKYHSTTKPTMAFEGDYYLSTTDGYIYSYDGTTWVKITDYNDARYKMAMTDMINLAATNPNVPFISVTNAWIKNLAAGNILADEIATKELVIGRKDENGNEQGTIQSANYVEGESGFLIKADGNVEFNKGRFRGGLGTQYIIADSSSGTYLLNGSSFYLKRGKGRIVVTLNLVVDNANASQSVILSGMMIPHVGASGGRLYQNVSLYCDCFAEDWDISIETYITDPLLMQTGQRIKLTYLGQDSYAEFSLKQTIEDIL